MNFDELGLLQPLADRCKSLGYTEPTPIQKRAIPVILDGADLIGCASTGTGKTAAFLLPTLQKLMTEKRETNKRAARVLILTPTRELASQVTDNLFELDAKRKIRAVTIVGGASFNRQNMELRKGVQVVIATPGRLMDHIENRTIDLSHIEVLILDEADRMLDMGFLPVIRQIIALLPGERQTLLFSATMSAAVESIARQYMDSPEIVDVNPRGKAAITVKQTVYPVALESKTNLLLHLLERERFERVLVFTRTRRGAERLATLLAARKHQVNRIHADRSQSQREAALRGFRDGRFRVLVATDIAARGIDVDSISHVINFDVPDVAEDYVHRIGRTGRAGNEGQALTLLTPVDELTMRSIEKLTGQKVERVVVEGFGGMTAKPERVAPTFGRRGGGGGYGLPRRAGRRQFV
ncbi:MAG: DEAD/DEAH box helicase [Blastocatellia bacterium]